LSVFRVSHEAQACPGDPHAVNVSGVQVLPVQQPFGHEVESQTHEPCEQCRPGPHEPPVPQRQAPSDEQLSLVVALQATHVEPDEPHDVSDRASHVSPLQHPLGHDVASHTHCPPAHRCPAAQAAWPPHEQCPAAQPSAPAPQAVHAAPPVPHVVAEAVLQVVPEQQPSGQTHPLHAPPTQLCVSGQTAHACPALPHADPSVPGLHVEPSQQPVVHELGSQTQ
jgi:hypothetical protein